MGKRKQHSSELGRSYTVFFRQESDNIITAHIPTLDIVTEGQTMEEAKDMAKDAIAGWIEAAREIGRPFPEDLVTARLEVG